MTIVLILIAVMLIVLNVKAIKKENNSFKGILDGKTKNISDLEIEIGKIRKEFAETLIEIQKENKDIKDKLEKLEIKDKNDVKKELKKIKKQSNFENIKDEKQINKNIKSVKTKEINKLLKEGYAIEEVAEKLKVGKGEVLLVKELYLK